MVPWLLVAALAAADAQGPWPANWSFLAFDIDRKPPRVSLDETVAHSGQRSLRIDVLQRSQPVRVTVVQYWRPQQWAGRKLHAACWVRAQGLQGTATLQLGHTTSLVRGSLASTPTPVSGTCDWTRQEVTAPIPANACQISVRLSISATAGTVWVDGFEVAKIGAETVPPEPAPIVPRETLPKRLVNGDFEHPPPAGGDQPVAAWQALSSASGGVALDLGQSRSGQASARLTANGGTASIIQNIDAVPWRGKRVRLSGWAKVKNLRGRASLFLGAYGPHYGLLVGGDDAWNPSGAERWSQVSVVIDVPNSADLLELGAAVSGTGQVWVDDVVLEAVGADVPVTAEPVAAKPIALDHLENGSFEQPEPDDPTRPGPPWELFLGKGARIAMDDQVKHSGRRSVRLDIDTADQYGRVWVSQAISARPYWGKRVRVTAWLKTEDADAAHLKVWVRGPLEEYDNFRGSRLTCDETYLRPLCGTVDWTQQTAVVDVPPGAWAIAIYGCLDAYRGTLWADDFSIEVVDQSVPVTADFILNDGPTNLDFEQAR